MAEIIDILTVPYSRASYFTVDVSKATTPGYVPVTPMGGTFGVWGAYSSILAGRGPQNIFQERDNIRILSAGFYIPESFTTADWGFLGTAGDGIVPSNSLQMTVRTAVRSFNPNTHTPRAVPGIIYLATATGTIGLVTFTSGHYYMYTTPFPVVPGPVVYYWKDLGTAYDNLANVDYMPGYGSSDNGNFMIPFPNYEVAFDVYCDIANLRGVTPDITSPNRYAEIINGYFYITGALYCNNISMVGVPAALDTKRITAIPFIKVLHTKPLLYADEVPNLTTAI